MQKKIPWVGAVLILAGVLLLVHRFGYITLHWHEIGWGVIALYGAVKAVNGFSRHSAGTAFWGTAFFLIGAVGFAHPLRFGIFGSLSGASVILLILGVSFLIAFLSNTQEWHFVIPSLFFAGLGALFVASDYDYFSRWDLVEAVGKYWPLALILFGVSLILNRRSA